MNMLYHLRVPTEMYAYIEAEYEGDSEGAVAEYHRLTELSKPRPVNEMPKADFDAILDDLLDDHSINGDPGVMEQMSPAQSGIIQAIKRSFKRLGK